MHEPSRRRALVRAVALVSLLGILVPCVFIAMPLPEGLLERRPATAVRFTDRSGGLLREVRSRQDGRSTPLAGGQVPPLVLDAFLASEDRRFFSHPGIDPLAILRAVVRNARAGRVQSGASTLTQQLARQLVPRTRSLPGKVMEALWALRLTAHLSRERILLEHLDRVPLGNATFGVEAAADLYFGRPAAHLSAGQAALLAGMGRAPARFDPFRHPDAAKRRMRYVLARMAALGSLTDAEARIASEAPLDLVDPKTVFRAPHLVSHLGARLASLGLDEAIAVETTLDPALQEDVERALHEELLGLAKKRVGQAAAVVVNNANGEVLAYAGSVDFLDDRKLGQNDGVRALRQPGSALKPFAYGLALSSGWTPASVLSDVEVHLSTPSGDYVPRNYDRRVHGPVRLRAALANSYNVPAVRLAESLLPERVLEVLNGAGFESLSREAHHYGLGVVLGNGDVSLRELARAYRGLARGGLLEPLSEIRAARDARGASLPVPKELSPSRFLPADAVALLTDILSDEGARAPAFGLDNALRFPFPVAAKTGTSRAYVDNWAVGFTRARTVAVWVGNFEGTPMRGVSGITGAGPLFKRILTRAMRGVAPEPLVNRSRFESASVCSLSGARAQASCPARLDEVFLPGTSPRGACTMHRSADVAGSERTILDVGPEYYLWARGEALDAGPWPATSSATQGSPPQPARLLSPGDGDEFLLDPAIPGDAQSIPVRALAPPGVKRLEVRTDEGARLALLSPFAARLPARRGRHWLELWTPEGQAPLASARYRVR